MAENTPEIVIIAAMDEKRGIGKDGKIPWRIPEDMEHFKNATLNHPVVMGRKTWDSIPKKFRPLSERTNIVVTRSEGVYVPGVRLAHSIEEAIDIAAQIDPEKVSVIGGAQIYTQTLPLADRLDLTIIEGYFEADTYFPDYTHLFPRVISETSGSSGGYNYRFVELSR